MKKEIAKNVSSGAKKVEKIEEKRAYETEQPNAKKTVKKSAAPKRRQRRAQKLPNLKKNSLPAN